MVPVFGIYSTYGITWGCASGVASLVVPIFVFDIFLLLGAPAEILLVWGFHWVFCCVHLLEFLLICLLYWQPRRL